MIDDNDYGQWSCFIKFIFKLIVAIEYLERPHLLQVNTVVCPIHHGILFTMGDSRRL